MAEGFGSFRDERQSLGKFSSNQRKYGSTETKQITNETYLKHYVKPDDTLQGVALKYGTAMQQIKRANNMWTSDSLFLREYLLIPLPTSPQAEESPSLPNGNGELDVSQIHPEIVTKFDLKMSRSASKDQKLDTVAENSESDITPKDFLSKFDNSLAKLRSNVQKLDETSNFPEDISNPLNYLPRRGSSKFSLRDRQQSYSDLSDASSEPDMVIKSKGVSRKIRTSLEKLEKAQDEMFQL